MTKLNKDGSPDMRYAENQHTHDRKWKRALFCAVLLGFLVACFSVAFITRPRSVKENIFEDVKVVPTATPTPEPRACYQNIDKIRCIGEDLGYDNKVIKTMIHIARAESNFRAEAKNGSSTASGIFQIIYGTWNSNKCQGSAFDAEDNIRCAYKIYAKRGFQPWYASSHIWLAVNN